MVERKPRTRNKLEESLDSLSLFKLQQAGRLGDARSSIQLVGSKDEAASAAEVPLMVDPRASRAEPPPVPFAIPTLPRGRVLRLMLLSTWGDEHYIGLSGIQIFASQGQEITAFRNISVSGVSSSDLASMKGDPRVLSNLIDGVNRTRDVLHMWMVPYSNGSRPEIVLELKEPTVIGAIRLWNYNESRIHSYRGVRDIIITLDSVPIFKGDITRAPGNVDLDEETGYGELVLFTTDAAVLDRISSQDLLLYEV